MQISYNALTTDITLWEKESEESGPINRPTISGGNRLGGQWARDFRNLAYRLQSQVEGLRKTTEIYNSSQQRLASAMDRFSSASGGLTDELKSLKF